MAAAAVVVKDDGEDLRDHPRCEKEEQTDIPCTEKTLPTSENPSSENVFIRRKKFYSKKQRSAEYVQMLHAKWLRQWIAGAGLNPIMLINQIMPSAEYSLLSSQNVSNEWHFVIQLSFNDQLYEGKGSSKKKAKSEAAEKAVRALAADLFGSLAERVVAAADGGIQLAVVPVDCPTAPPCPGSSSDPVPNVEASQVPDSECEMHQNGLISQVPLAASDNETTWKPTADELTSRIATRILNEIRPGTKYEVVFANDKHITCMYTIATTVDGRRFEASGPSKQKAKASVAEIVLTALFNLKFTKLTDGTPIFAGNDEDWMVLRAGQLNSTLLEGLDFLGTKSPLMWLNELYPSASFEFHNVASVVVDPHTLYEVTVCVESRTFEGTGRSKKQAKLSAAVAALRDLNATGKFAQRIADKEELKKRHYQPWHIGHPRTFGPRCPRQPLHLAGGRLPQNVAIRDPFTVLNEIHPDLNVELMQSNSDSYTVSVMVQGRHEVGHGRTRMYAMNNAAEKVLRNLGIWPAYASQARDWLLEKGRGNGRFQPDVVRSMIGNLDLFGDRGIHGSTQAYGFQSRLGSEGFSSYGGNNLSTMHGESSMGGERMNRGSGSRGRGYRGQFRRFNVQRFGSRSREAYVQGTLQSNSVVSHVPSNAGHGFIPNANELVR